MENVETGTYVGQPVVRGVPTHHLAFTQKNIDWQLWIEDGANPVPRIDVSKVKRPQSTSGAVHYQGTGSVRLDT